MQRLWTRLPRLTRCHGANRGFNGRALSSQAGTPPSASTSPSPAAKAFSAVSLSDPLPDEALEAFQKSQNAKTKTSPASSAAWKLPSVAEAVTTVTTLSNGLRVATEPCPGRYCTVGVIVDSGSRYEVAHPSGVCHYLEKLAFGATDKFRDKDDIMNR